MKFDPAPVIRPNVFGSLVTVLTGFHCTKLFLKFWRESKRNTTLRIVSVVLLNVFHLPSPSMGSPGLLPPTPFSLCHSSDRSCCSTTCISLTIPPLLSPRVFCYPPLPFCVTPRIVTIVLLHVFHLPSPQYGLPGSFATHPSLSVSTPLEGDDDRKGRLVSSSSSVSRIMSI